MSDIKPGDIVQQRDGYDAGVVAYICDDGDYFVEFAQSHDEGIDQRNEMWSPEDVVPADARLEAKFWENVRCLREWAVELLENRDEQ